MAKTYCICQGMRGSKTACGGNDGTRAAVQAYDGSVVISNWYDGETLKVRVGTNDGSASCSDCNSHDFVGTFDDFKEALNLLDGIRSGRVSVIRHRKVK